MSLHVKWNTPPRRLGIELARTLCALLLLAALGKTTLAQEPEPQHPHVVTPLADLLEEAEKNNPQIEAARQGWQAAKQVPTQVSTLPDPQFTLQHLSVGSPRPFAGYTNSDFAYIGLGVTQDIPYPGKLRLKGEIAKREAEMLQQQVETVRRAVLAEVKASYFHLAYLAKTLAILERDGELLKQVEQAADARYRSGMGTQQDVLQAQLQKTKLVRENRHAPSGSWQSRNSVEADPQPLSGFTGHRAVRSHGISSLAELSGASGGCQGTKPGTGCIAKDDRQAIAPSRSRTQGFLS
jgi:outer membrane protein TolC